MLVSLKALLKTLHFTNTSHYLFILVHKGSKSVYCYQIYPIYAFSSESLANNIFSEDNRVWLSYSPSFGGRDESLTARTSLNLVPFVVPKII